MLNATLYLIDFESDRVCILLVSKGLTELALLMNMVLLYNTS